MMASLAFCILLIIPTSYGAEALIKKTMIEELKETVSWEVESYEDNIFKDWTLEEFKEQMCGERLDPAFETQFLDSQVEQESDSENLPEHFDSRDKWGKCVHPIRTQGHCGSCWAHGLTEALSDRFCIKKKDVILSVQDLVSCDKTQHGCNGGDIKQAVHYFERSGCVSEECFPYVAKQVPCPSKCTKEGVKWVKHYSVPGSGKVTNNKDTMKTEIMNNGPITTRFNHYEDFTHYKGGVYYHKTGKFICGHVMKTIGWGKADGMNYWTLANTYGPQWGEKGFVRFKMGDVGIDEYMVYTTPRV